jgi:hypothetical protein
MSLRLLLTIYGGLEALVDLLLGGPVSLLTRSQRMSTQFQLRLYGMNRNG